MSESGDYVTKQQRVKVVEWNGTGDHPDVTETGPGFYSLGRGPSWPGVPVHKGCCIVEYEETGYRHVVSRDELLKRYRRVPRSWRRVEDVERACEVLSRHKFAGIDDWKAHVIGYGNVVAATMIDWPGKTITIGDDAACEIAATLEDLGTSESTCACGGHLDGSHDHRTCGPPLDADAPDAPTLREEATTLDDLARIAYEACVGPRDKFPDLTPFERHSESYRRDWRNAVKAVLAAAPLCEEVAAVLVDMDGRAGLMGDQGAFQPWRERLRTALAEGGGA